VFKDSRRRDDLQPSIDEVRRWLAPPSVHARSDVERRGDARRGVERRTHASTRRAEDAERNQHRRALLLSFFSTMGHDDLLLWIDRLWLGHATDVQLDALVASVRDSPHFAERIASSRTSGRASAAGAAAGPHPPTNAWLTAEWRDLSEQLTVLAALRRQHHDAGNQKRNATAKSSQYREAGLASPIGSRMRAAGLFEEFFDRQELTPEETAARLLQREVQTQLGRIETSAAATRRGLGSLTAAAAAVTALALLPRWRTFYRGLRDWAQTSPPDNRKP
jgi:hypothetical protein